MSSTEASPSSSSQEHLSPVSTPATTPAGSPTTISPAVNFPASTSERPVTGSFKFLPRGTELVWCSKENPGSPWNHPVLVLPDEDPHPDLVTVLFATTKDVVSYCKSKKWGCNYVPIEGQSHPWREAIPLAQGSFEKATSMNVTTVYRVHWQDLQEINVESPDGLSPSLSAEALQRVMEYVKAPIADINAPWSPTFVQPTASMVRLAAPCDNSAAPAVQVSLDPVSPAPATHSAPVLAPVAVLATVPTQECSHQRPRFLSCTRCTTADLGDEATMLLSSARPFLSPPLYTGTLAYLLKQSFLFRPLYRYSDLQQYDGVARDDTG